MEHIFFSVSVKTPYLKVYSQNHSEEQKAKPGYSSKYLA